MGSMFRGLGTGIQGEGLSPSRKQWYHQMKKPLAPHRGVGPESVARAAPWPVPSAPWRPLY